MKMNRILTTWAMLLVLATTSAASILTIRIMQDGPDTRWSINNRNVTMTELEGLLVRLASIDTNQFLYIVAQTNVPSSKLVQTIGVVQRTGLHNLGLICSGADGTNAGTWQITIDAKRKHLPTCITDEHSLSGFQKEDITELEILPLITEEKERPTKGSSRTGDPLRGSTAGQP